MLVKSQSRATWFE